MYDDDPEDILLQNRVTVPSTEKLMIQVNSLARLAINAKDVAARLAIAEATLERLGEPETFINPVRALNVEFGISDTKTTTAIYTVELGLTAAILGVDLNESKVSLLINGVEVDSARQSLQSTLLLGLSFNPISRYNLSAVVPPGAVVKLASTITGTGTANLLFAQEITK